MKIPGIVTNLEEAAEFLKTVDKPTRVYVSIEHRARNSYYHRIITPETRIENGSLWYNSVDGSRCTIAFTTGGIMFTNYWLCVADSLKRFKQMPELEP